MSGLDNKVQFKALITSINEAGLEAEAGAELMRLLGIGAAEGADAAKQAAQEAKETVKDLGNEAQI